ncbi:hypothetical protein BJ878DRAFT_486865 [Calycina marina]|uniref:DUF7918 domain-containing protein n=1 Tax=Calycina marina TaxID=1763456 RepID=A0A9P7ZAW5_9HELO|nr:hypothetical protein BJ878DRAFT_486865 [Calycina marina]
MPCFKGIAVSVHAQGLPLPEYSIQKQSRVSRVNAYIPVPKSKDVTSLKPEPSKFAISITLLTPHLAVPYSTPKSTADNPNPKPQIVTAFPGAHNSHSGSVGPYIPITKSENETIAAYIYFDGRPKEEVATLLRPGEETWVNSRWVQVPASEGGGLAEREFLFREVGLERWLNGLDLDGQDAAAKIEKRRQRFEKRRRRRKQEDSDDELADLLRSGPKAVRYGDNEISPIDDDFSSSDDDAPPEATGQIKVAMFRVLASGEIKRGEYSPQFDAHDDDEEGSKDKMTDANGPDVDHTTSFAKPKTLDPKSISTQTVTGIDGPDKPFAVFTFFYRGERQLQKMGILESKQKVPSAIKRRSGQMLDFSTLGPLKPTGTVGFTSFRDTDPSVKKSKKVRKARGAGVIVEDSDEEDDDNLIAPDDMPDVDDREVKTLLSPEDAKFSGELADGVGRIKLKRQHSAEPINATSRRSPGSVGSNENIPPAEKPDGNGALALAPLPTNIFGLPDDSIIGSPLKKHRASLNENEKGDMQKRSMGFGSSGTGGDIVAAAEAAQLPLPEPAMKADEDGEL